MGNPPNTAACLVYLLRHRTNVSVQVLKYCCHLPHVHQTLLFLSSGSMFQLPQNLPLPPPASSLHVHLWSDAHIDLSVGQFRGLSKERKVQKNPRPYAQGCGHSSQMIQSSSTIEQCAVVLWKMLWPPGCKDQEKVLEGGDI